LQNFLRGQVPIFEMSQPLMSQTNLTEFALGVKQNLAGEDLWLEVTACYKNMN
jgi:hypothetical protein